MRNGLTRRKLLGNIAECMHRTAQAQHCRLAMHMNHFVRHPYALPVGKRPGRTAPRHEVVFRTTNSLFPMTLYSAEPHRTRGRETDYRLSGQQFLPRRATGWVPSSWKFGSAISRFETSRRGRRSDLAHLCAKNSGPRDRQEHGKSDSLAFTLLRSEVTTCHASEVAIQSRGWFSGKPCGGKACATSLALIFPDALI
jgi:hypothetical protein